MAGQKAGKLDVLDKDLMQVYKLATESDDFAQFLRDPSIPKSQKSAALQEVLNDAKVSDITKNFFMVLAENNRLNLFDKIMGTFGELMAAARGQVTCTITSAEVLGKKDLEDIKMGLKNMLKKGESLLIRQKVEPEIVGGIIVQIADKYIDLSIRTRVKKIEQLILETV
ncbi:hypothetical protein WJX81_004496 [Elliptochloris bilobata]|uniref:F-type ATPase subunit delta n=1 Tax=Elliptochloris bilobata TaxID=381761 RepID=A0AAW1S9H5_9CHLO